jgi:hypothetical protein
VGRGRLRPAGALRARPAGEGVLTAFRAALRAGYTTLTSKQRDLEQHRAKLIAAIPEVRAAHLDHLTSALREFTLAVAERAGRTPDDGDVVAVSGAVIGILMISQLAAVERSSSEPDAATVLDDALARLQQGFDAL